MNRRSVIESCAGLFAQLVLLAHPVHTRRQNGDDMRTTVRDSVREARRRGILPAARTAAAECFDLFRTGLAARHGTRTSVPVIRQQRGGVRVVPTWLEWRRALRRLTSAPGYSAVVVAALALGIGANTVVFSVADAALFRGLPYPNGARLVEVFNHDRSQKFSYPGLLPNVFQEWRRHTDVFDGVEGFAYTTLIVTGGEEPESIAGAQITPGLFDMLGVAPALGRDFDANEGTPGRDHVVILSDALWRRQFGPDPSALGRDIVLNDERYTVVGVMPRGFRFPAEPQKLWLPTPADGTGTLRRVEALAILKQGVTQALAQERLDGIAADLNRSQPIAAGWDVLLMEFRSARVNDTTRRALQMVLGAVVLVLLIACANVANLFFAQAIGRQRELAIRAALGASRWRLVRELLAESVLLAFTGGLAGLLFAWLGVDAAAALAPEALTRWSASVIGIDRRVLLFTLALTMSTGVLFGILPAIRASRAQSSDALKGRTTSGSGGHSRLRATLVVAEVALSVVLLVGAALLIRSFSRLQQVDVGFNPENLLSISLSVPTDRYPGPARKALFDDLSSRIARMPGVTSVTTSNGVPTAGGAIHFADALVVEGSPAPSTKKLVILPNTSAAPNFFATLGIPLLEGRTFTPDDPSATAIISRSMAQRYWPGKSAVGGRFRLSDRAEWLTVVGVAGEIRALGVDDARSEIEMYSPLWARRAPAAATATAARPAGPPAAPQKAARSFANAMLLIRADKPMSLVPSIKAAVWSIDKDQPIEKIVLVEDLLAASLKEQRFALVLMTSFAVLALVLAAAGLYAVLSNLVAQRRQEIGIRVALGARTSHVMNLVVIRGLALTLLGIAIGLAGSFALARYIRSQLFEVSARDPFSFATVAIVLAAVALLASWVPTRRALSIDPATALRTE